jgi:hypothetical protein
VPQIPLAVVLPTSDPVSMGTHQHLTPIPESRTQGTNLFEREPLKLFVEITLDVRLQVSRH